jgi:prepilin-type N-terminal cleavage/methylation domain-containing protein
MADEGFTLVELLVVMLILGILTMIAVPTFVGLAAKAQAAAAQANVSSAVPAAEAYYQANYGGVGDADGSAATSQYSGMTVARLNAQAPGIASSLVVAVSASGGSYCLQNTQASSTYHYVGGLDAGVVAHGGQVYVGACPSLP